MSQRNFWLSPNLNVYAPATGGFLDVVAGGAHAGFIVLAAAPKTRVRLYWDTSCVIARPRPAHAGGAFRTRSIQRAASRLPPAGSDSTLAAVIFIHPGMSLRERTRPGLGIIEPCLPSPAKAPPAGPGWIHEIKHDGFRIMARRDSAGVRLITS